MAIFAFVHVPDSATKEAFSWALVRKIIPDLDLIGFSLFVPPSIMFLLALQFGSGNTYAWDSATVIGLFVGAVVGVVIFVIWERRMGDRAMFPGSMIKKRIIWTSSFYGMFNLCCMITASNFLPTYFQAVKGNSPTTSGVHVLPSILSQLTSVITSGALSKSAVHLCRAVIDKGTVTKLGYYLPWAFASSVIMTIGNGLVSTFTPTTTVAKWIGFQIVVGAGRGLGMQTVGNPKVMSNEDTTINTPQSLIAVQHAVSQAEVPVAMAYLVFLQNLGGAVAVVLSNTIFAQTLTKRIPQYAPSVSPQAVLDAGSGAGAVRSLVVGHEDELNGVLRAYSEGLRNIFYLLVSISAVSIFMTFGMGWVDVRKKKETKTVDDIEVQSDTVGDTEGEKALER
jgi:hypothetical protein